MKVAGKRKSRPGSFSSRNSDSGTPINGHRETGPAGPVGTDAVEKVENGVAPKSCERQFLVVSAGINLP
jgi:hypothetical protein